MEVSEKASVASGKAPRRIIFTFCNLLSDKKENQNRGPQMNSPTLPQKVFKFSLTSPVPIRRSGQAFMVIGSPRATNYVL